MTRIPTIIIQNSFDVYQAVGHLRLRANHSRRLCCSCAKLLGCFDVRRNLTRFRFRGFGHSLWFRNVVISGRHAFDLAHV
jgi:hypothetical protein